MSFIYLDIETDNSEDFGLDPFRAKVSTIQIMLPSGKKKILQDPEDLSPIRDILENNTVVGHNLKFEAKFLKHHFGVTLKNVYDTMLAEQIISGGQLAGFKKGKSLKDLAFKYCGIDMSKAEQCGFECGKALTASQINYALKDIECLPKIMQQQRAKIALLGLENTIDIEMKALPAMAWLELSGINADLEKLAEIKAGVLQQQAENKAFLIDSLGGINLNSPKQLLSVLRSQGFDLKGTGKTDLSKYQDSPIIKALKQYREASKLLSGFIEPLPGFINPTTGRIHATFNQYGALSGRLTSEKPNMQQQPSRFKQWRSIFTARPGYKIIAADYSQIELRIVGQLAKDPKYIKTYNEGLDLHKLTAAQVFKVPVEQVTKQQRSVGKTINFGLNYGMWTQGLKSKIKNDVGIDITLEEAQQFIDEFKRSYPAVDGYLKKQSREGLNNLNIRTAAGRLCKFAPPKDEKEEGTIKRESKNLPVQGLCADMVKIAMGEIFLALESRGVKFINTVHDELVFECKAEEAEEVAAIIKTEMEKAGSMYLKDLPCIAETTIDDYWRKD